MRTFIAIEIPKNIKNKLYNSFNKERERTEGVKWVEEKNLHITLKFMGEIEENKIPLISEVLEEVQDKFKTFEVYLKEAGAFPDLRFPRVLWVGIHPEEKIKEIFDFVEKKLEKTGIPREKRNFHPHITVARVKKRGKINFEKKNFGDDFKIKKIVLFKSELNPEGPVYTPLKEVELKNE